MQVLCRKRTAHIVASEKSRMPLEPKDEPEENELTHAALAQGLNEFFAGVFPEEQQRASSFADLATGKKQTDKKGKKITKQTSVRLKTLMINPSSQLRSKLSLRVGSQSGGTTVTGGSSTCLRYLG